MALENGASLDNPVACWTVVEAAVARSRDPLPGWLPGDSPAGPEALVTQTPPLTLILPKAYILGELPDFAPGRSVRLQLCPGRATPPPTRLPASRTHAVTKRLHRSGPSVTTLTLGRIVRKGS